MTQEVGPKGQVVIPKAIRDRLGLRPGDAVVVTSDDRGALVQPAVNRVQLKGRLAGLSLVQALNTDRLAEPRGVRER
jgi:AbrB family looped-hinge helix DNA binding protein